MITENRVKDMLTKIKKKRKASELLVSGIFFFNVLWLHLTRLGAQNYRKE